MANSDAASGLRPAMYQGGACYTGAANLYYIPATDTDAAVYIGGLVKLAGSADADGVPSVTGNITTGDAVVGVAVGFDPAEGAGADGRDSTTYRANSTERYVWVADDPNVLFEVQEDSVGAALAATDVGSVADLGSLTSGSTVTGLSSIEIDSSTATASGDNTEDVLIVRLVNRPDNVIGDNAKWLVRLNNHAFVDGNAGA